MFKNSIAPIGATFIVALCATLLTVPSAGAVVLAPGGVINPTGTTFAANPDLGGLVINDNVLGFRMDPTPATPLMDVGGNVQNRVVRNGSNNLIFAPRIRDTFNIDGGIFAVTAFRLEGFGTFSTDVDFRTDGLGDKGFTSVSRSVSGDIMTFRYDNPLLVDAINPPGRQEESFFPSILTDAVAFADIGLMTIFGQLVEEDASGALNPLSDLVSVTIDGIAVPVAPVPLPGAMLLFGPALAGLVLARRQRRGEPVVS